MWDAAVDCKASYLGVDDLNVAEELCPGVPCLGLSFYFVVVAEIFYFTI